MDPNANLAEQIHLAREIQATIDAAPEYGMSDEDRRANEDRGERLAELVLALQWWRSQGGFPPDAALADRASALRRQLAVATWGPDPSGWPSWSCATCPERQRNGGYALECGRCSAPRLLPESDTSTA